MSNPNVWTVLISVKIFQCGAVNKSLEVCFSQSVWSRHFYLKCFVFNHPLSLGLSDYFSMVAIPVQGKVGGFSKNLEQPPKQLPTLFVPPLFLSCPSFFKRCRGGRGDSRDQLECIDPRLAARMVNQLKCLRMRKFFQQQNFVSSEFSHRNYPWPLARASPGKRMAAFIISVHVYLCIPFFELTCFRFCKISKFQHMCSPTVLKFLMSEGLLDLSAFYLYRERMRIGIG